jgi:nucleoside 2-deoxyribosyltransferase
MGSRMRNKPRVYLAASFSRRREIGRVSEELSKAGIAVCSVWTTWQRPSMRITALGDLAALKQCGIFVKFLDDLRSKRVPSHLATGSRMWEQGYAYAKRKIIILVGERKQCLFDWLPGTIHLKSTKSLKRLLTKIETGRNYDRHQLWA